jgi:recombination protein RecA
MRSKEIEELKNNIKLSERQRSIIVGTLLGDGHLETTNKGKTCRLKITHSVKQREYTEWLYNELKNLVRTPPQRKFKNGVSKIYEECWFNTYSLGSLRFYSQQFYVNGEKVIPKIIGKLLDPLAIAVWFMDDGSYKSNRHKTYIIHTLSFKKKDLQLLSEVLERKFWIKTKLHKQYYKSSVKWRLYILSESADKFKNLVELYVLPSLKYKLGNIMPKE